jgi:hypothetical protein
LYGKNSWSTRYCRRQQQLVVPTQNKLNDDLGITDFLDIPMDGIQELDKLDEYLSQAIE